MSAKASHCLLSICITTLNRADFVVPTLQMLLSATAKHRRVGVVEIIVVDNNSDDETFAALSGLVGEVGLAVLKNDTRLEVCRSIFGLIEQARGQYFWCVGDDDLVQDGYIASVIQSLQRRDRVLTLTGRQDFYEESEISLLEPSFQERLVPFSEIVEQFFAYDRLFGFLTSIIYTREFALAAFKSQEAHLSNNYINKYASWISSFEDETVFIEGPTIFKRCSIGSGSHFQDELKTRIKTFIFDQVDVALMLYERDPGIGEKALHKYLGSLPTLLKFRKDGADMGAVYSELKRRNVPNKFLIGVLTATWLPMPIIQLGYLVRKLLRSVRHHRLMDRSA